MRILVSCKQILVSYRIALALVTCTEHDRNASISCSRKRSSHLPPTGLLLAGVALEQVESYCYLRVFGVIKANLVCNAFLYLSRHQYPAHYLTSLGVRLQPLGFFHTQGLAVTRSHTEICLLSLS